MTDPSIPQVARRMSSSAADFAAWAAQFIVDGTRAEVLMVVQNAQDEVWLHHKGEWRLPTGTLQRGEDATACVAREVVEEFGVPLPVIRALAILHLEMDVPEVRGAFLSYLFLLDGGTHIPEHVPDEGIDGWRTVPVGELYAEAARLRALTPTPEPKGWRRPFWGAFRALEHELVADLLTTVGGDKGQHIAAPRPEDVT